MTYKTEKQLIGLLQAACQKAGSQKTWAKQNEISAQYVCDILKGRRDVSDAIAAKLGYEIERKFKATSTAKE